MDKVANLTDRERQELFQQTASNRGFHPAIAEKDFWVCWSLIKLYDRTSDEISLEEIERITV